MPTDPSSEWERIRHLTMDQLVTWTKLRGSGFSLMGSTRPEGWAFALFLGIASTPANQAAVELVLEHGRDFERLGATKTGRLNPESIAGGIRWLQQTVHQAHHAGPLDECINHTCQYARDLAMRAGDIS